MPGITDKYDYKHLIVTRGPKGSIYYSKDKGFHEAPQLASIIIEASWGGGCLFCPHCSINGHGCAARSGIIHWERGWGIGCSDRLQS